MWITWDRLYLCWRDGADWYTSTSAKDAYVFKTWNDVLINHNRLITMTNSRYYLMSIDHVIDKL